MSQTKAQLIDNLVQPITGALGSASAPTFSFTTDPNTGIYSPGADQLALSTGGSGRLFVDANGNVGINASSPSYILQVESNTNSSQGVWVRNISTGSSASSHVLAVSAAGELTLRAHSAAHSVWPATALIASSSGLTGGLALNTGTTAPIAFLTNNTERFRITSAGLVGIGTSTVGAVLHVKGGNNNVCNVDNDGSQYTNISILNNGTEKASVYWDNTNNLFTLGSNAASSQVLFRAANAERMRLTSTGLGIGVTSPAAPLDLSGDVIVRGANSTIRFKDSGNTTQYLAIYGNSTDANINAGVNNLVFYSAGTERARFDGSGRLLVGTSSTAATIRAVFAGGDGGGSVGSVQIANTGNSLTDGQGLGTLGFVDSDHSSGKQDYARITGARDGGTWSSTSKPTRLVFSTTADGASSPTERMRINSSGITRFSDTGSYLNTASNAHEFSNSTTSICLSVYSSNANFTDSVLQACAARNTSNSTYNLLKCSRVGVADVFIVRDSGNAQNANNSYTGTSDAKLKENIVDATPQWDDIKALQVRKFNFKEETGYSTHTQIGLIAQEVEAVSPGLVDEAIDRDAEGNDLGTVTKSVNYSVLYMKAVKALQEAMERIEQLEAKVSVLESKP